MTIIVLVGKICQRKYYVRLLIAVWNRFLSGKWSKYTSHFRAFSTVFRRFFCLFIPTSAKCIHHFFGIACIRKDFCVSYVIVHSDIALLKLCNHSYRQELGRCPYQIYLLMPLGDNVSYFFYLSRWFYLLYHCVLTTIIMWFCQHFVKTCTYCIIIDAYINNGLTA